jgi:hypothetical protein
MMANRWAVGAGVACAVFVMGAPQAEGQALAASKEECLDAHSRGQDLRDAGHLTSARQAFLSCAQTSCPALIQGDCARFSEELDRLVPSVSFAARDPSGADLPDTAVYVDDQPVATRLADGKSYELDPGKHLVRFIHDGRDTTVTVVLTEGDKGRSVLATFADAASAAHAMPALPAPVVQRRRPSGPLFVAGLGAAALVTGGVLTFVGLHRVPSDCSVSSRECVAPPGDPSFDQAHSGITLANYGLGAAIGGAAVLLGGTFWYFMQPLRPSRELASVVPWVGDRAGGVGIHTRF